MKTIDIDDDVYEFLAKNARPFLDTDPNSVLRRLLGFSAGEPTRSQPSEPIQAEHPSPDMVDTINAVRRSKAPKANLRELLRLGKLRDGERLYLVDYHGHRVGQFSASISNGWLSYEGEHYTMSDLAQSLLKKVGFKSDSVRGPAHWANAQGVTIKDMWDEVIKLRKEQTQI